MKNKYVILYFVSFLFLTVEKIQSYYPSNIDFYIGSCLEMCLLYYLWKRIRVESILLSVKKINFFNFFWVSLGGVVISSIFSIVPLFVPVQWLWTDHRNFYPEWEVVNIPFLWFFYSVLLIPFMEEFVFRGIIFNCLCRQNIYGASILTSVLFAFTHTKYIYGEYFLLFLSSLFMNFLFSKYGLWASFVNHAINNLYAYYVLRKIIEYGTDHPLFGGVRLVLSVVVGIFYFLFSLKVFKKSENLYKEDNL